MRAMAVLTVACAMCAFFAAGCGDKPGQPAQVQVNEEQQGAAQRAADNPIAQSEMVRQALKDHPKYEAEIAPYEPQAGAGETAPPPPTGGAETPPPTDPAGATETDVTPPPDTPATETTEPAATGETSETPATESDE